MDIIIATGNSNKVREINEILEGIKINNEEVHFYSMKEKGIDIDIVEDGDSFRENSLIKARAVAVYAPGCIVLADDSGLEVDYINKEPGIYSARYMGTDTSYRVKNANIIERLKDAEGEQRSARFVCAVSAVLPNKEELSTVQTMEGRIGYEERGENGFGYDPIFYTPPYDKSNSELSSEAKNAISHRGKAFRAMKEMLEEKLG